VRADELLGDILLSAEVARRVEGEGWNGGSAVCIMSGALVDATDGEEGPSRGVASVGDVVGRGLQEVEFVQGGAVYGAGQDGEELEEETAGENY
jgi:hypothetical protein